jgi:hypothetical protein
MSNSWKILLIANLLILWLSCSQDHSADTTERSWVCEEEKLEAIGLHGDLIGGEEKLSQELQKKGLADVLGLIVEDGELDQQAVWLSAALLPPFESIGLNRQKTTGIPEFQYAKAVQQSIGDSAPQLEPDSYGQYAPFMCAAGNSRLVARDMKSEVASLPGVQEVIVALMNPDEWDAEALLRKGELQGFVLDLYSMFREKLEESQDSSQIKKLISAKIAEAYPGIGWYRKNLSGQQTLWALVDLKFKGGIEPEITPTIPIMLVADGSGIVTAARIAESNNESQSWYYSFERDKKGYPTHIRILIRRQFEGKVSYDIFALCSQQRRAAEESK